jgi:outer membrane protein
LQLNIPIFSRFNTNTAIKQAKINLKMAEINYQQKRMNLQKTVQQAYFDASAAYKKYLAAKKQVLALQQAFKYTEHRFDLGLTTPLDYNDAKNKLSVANSDMLQSKYDFIFRTKILDYYRGKELKL